MQEERNQSACKTMANINGLPVASSNNSTQTPFPTPSPFSISVASSGWNSRPTISYWDLFLRFVGLLFSFSSALSLVIISSPKKKHEGPSSFAESPQLLYCFIVTILAFAYSAFQLFKGIFDIAHKGILMSDLISDYTSFILDQLVGYLLVSSSSVAVAVVQEIEKSSPLWRATIISASFSLANFLVIATCALFSGYKLCKRISW
ncbi:CASP-like protein 4A4 isoform X2 [Ziziphus jujuba]|uniref:CASP-like protein n=1 Tax=Ziziphus jujuba TaxID=326968 RepID=A0A6P4BB44_ZIZJJ|nr:CASP-like protein 4A4 isoform X2 [Ziziphus jujuba]